MGRQLLDEIGSSNDCAVAGIWSRSVGDLDDILAVADVAIDFTLPGATRQIVASAVQAGTPLVSGVSGFGDEQLQALVDAADSIPILHDRNMSYGIALLMRMLSIAGPGTAGHFRSTIYETHHVHKLDAPSGTALMLGEALAASRDQNFDAIYRYDENSTEVASDLDELRFVVERRGDVAGDHKIVFFDRQRVAVVDA